MPDHQINISSVEKDGDDGLIVTFSDGTTAGYVVEELLELRPVRLAARKSNDPNPQPTPATHS
jgi:hypothetical protein